MSAAETQARDTGPVRHSVWGFDDKDNCFVAEGMTAQETQQFARDNNLRGFHRAPTKGIDYRRKHAGGKNGLANSFLRKPDGSYGRPVPMYQWLAENYNYAQIIPPGC